MIDVHDCVMSVRVAAVSAGMAHGFEGGDTISRGPATFCMPGGHETKHCIVFSIVIMTSKPAENEIT